MKYDKNDPTLTAYALGELSPEEAKVVQESIQGDAALQAEVEALRNLADDLTNTLAAEPLPSGGPIPLDHAELTETASDAPTPVASNETTSDGPGFRRILLLVASVVIICGVGLLLSPGGREYLARVTPEADEAATATSEQATAESPDMDGEVAYEMEEEIDFSGLESGAYNVSTSLEANLSLSEEELRRQSGINSNSFDSPAVTDPLMSGPHPITMTPETSSPSERPRENEGSEGRDYGMAMGGTGGMGGESYGGWDRESVSGGVTDGRGYGEGGYGGGMGGMSGGEVRFHGATGSPTDSDPSTQMGSIAGPGTPQAESTPSNPGEIAGYEPTPPTEASLVGGGTGPVPPMTPPTNGPLVDAFDSGSSSGGIEAEYDRTMQGYTARPTTDPSDGRPSRVLTEERQNYQQNIAVERNFNPEELQRQLGQYAEEAERTANANGALSESHTLDYRTDLYENIRETGRYAERLPALGLPRVRGEVYFDVEENQFQLPADEEQRFSTFSIDVDTGSYANVRRFVMQQGVVPPPSAVRIEEMVNYFNYDYEPPTEEDEAPFATHVEVGPCPWVPEHRLAKIGIKGVELSASERPPLNLVFLLDVSGSMSSSNKLPLVKQGMTMLAETLRRKDHVAIVTYAGNARTVLPPTSGRDMGTIMDAINALSAGGSTAGAAGIQQAYDVVQENYDPEAVNRIILCTDGDFNVGVSRFEDLLQIVEDKTDETGAFITILGFGMGNLKEGQLEQLADSGDGNYGYVDNEDEAHKLLVEELSGTLIPIAKNVKIQVDFNPANVQAYRLIGYENRALATEDFYNDAVDAGEIGAGHTVTAIYEIIPPGVEIPTPDVPRVDPSRYDPVEPPVEEPVDEVEDTEIEGVDGFAPSEFENELFFLKLRYMEPDGDEGIDLAFPVQDPGINVQTSKDFEFASAVALCGMLLRGSDYAGDGSFATVLELALSGQGEDDRGYRAEFIEIVQRLAPAEATVEAAAEGSPE